MSKEYNFNALWGKRKHVIWISRKKMISRINAPTEEYTLFCKQDTDAHFRVFLVNNL